MCNFGFFGCLFSFVFLHQNLFGLGWKRCDVSGTKAGAGVTLKVNTVGINKGKGVDAGTTISETTGSCAPSLGRTTTLNQFTRNQK